MKNKGFTLVEIVVAITISVMVIGGLSVFLTKTQTDILSSRQKTAVYTNLSDFIGAMRNFTKLYESGSIVVSGSGYNTVLMMKRDKTSGVLIGVVGQGNAGNVSKLDPVANKGIYGKKVIAYQKLTGSQVADILANTGSVYGIDFSDEGLFKELPVTDFSVTPYNTGAILEYHITVEVPYYESSSGKLRNTITQEVTPLSFTLDF